MRARPPSHPTVASGALTLALAASMLAGCHADRGGRSASVPHEWRAALEALSSSAERRDLLLAVVQARSAETAALAEVLGTVERVDSPEDRRAVLLAVAGSRALPDLLPRYLQAASTLSSPEDRHAVLGAALPAGALTAEDAVRWLESVGEVGSDATKAELLLIAVSRLPAGDAVDAALRAALETIDSGPRYNEVATAFLRSRAP